MISFFLFMVITFLTMYNKNQFYYNTYENYKNTNLNELLAKNKSKKTLLPTTKVGKKWSWTYNLYITWSFKMLQLCLFGKFLLTMRHQKYDFDHCNYLWDRDQTGNKTCQQTFFRRRISMSDLQVSSSVRKCVFYRPELTGK